MHYYKCGQKQRRSPDKCVSKLPSMQFDFVVKKFKEARIRDEGIFFFFFFKRVANDVMISHSSKRPTSQSFRFSGPTRNTIVIDAAANILVRSRHILHKSLYQTTSNLYTPARLSGIFTKRRGKKKKNTRSLAPTVSKQSTPHHTPLNKNPMITSFARGHT